MCGRFTMTSADAALLAADLGVPADSLTGYVPRYNIAPTQEHFIVRMKAEERELLRARWGLVNSWAKDASMAARTINARAETLATRPAFRDAYAHRRCVVPADGFFEWRGPKNDRQPLWFHRPDGGLLLFAGLYESWQPPAGEWQRTFTIVTTRANALVESIHDRMPVILEERDADRWMFATTTRAELLGLVEPPPARLLVATPVSSRVNRPGNDDASILEPAGPTLAVQ
jgi:putative SOS response-associated peptidase YedK